MARMLKGIVFDLDGTLVDSLSATFEAFNFGITSLGGRKHSAHEIMAYFGPGEKQIFEALLGPEKAPEAYRLCCQYMDENVGKAPLHAGVADLMEKLKSAGVPIAIFTGRGWDTTELILKHHGILDRFVTVVANDHVASPKPSPEGLYLACKRMRLEPQEVYFAGDSASDMAAARLARAHGIAALWDILADRKKLEAHSPRHWASDPSQIWEIWSAG